MTTRTQKHLAVLAALLLGTLVLIANARLLLAATGSQPACVAAEGGPAPAGRAC